MFYTNHSIHHPDSPRHMDAGTWVSGRTVVVKNQFDPSRLTLNPIDVTAHLDQIEQGVVRLTPVTRYDRLAGTKIVYKLPQGMYTQQGFAGGFIDIPIPDIYIHIDMSISQASEGVYVQSVTLDIASNKQGFLPISNMYAYTVRHDIPDFILPNAGDDTAVSNICIGDFFYDRRTTFPNAVDAINDIIAVLPIFPFIKGNLDLSLSRRDGYDEGFFDPSSEGERGRSAYNNYNGQSDYSEKIYALHIGAWLSRQTQSHCRRSVCSHVAYWLFLHYASQHPDFTIDDLYDKLSKTTSFDQFFERFGMSAQEYCAFVDEYQSSENALLIEED